MGNNNFEIQTFALLVKEMREHQKNYFRTRGAEELTRCKLLEQAVDLQIKSYLNDKGKQISLNIR